MLTALTFKNNLLHKRSRSGWMNRLLNWLMVAALLLASLPRPVVYAAPLAAPWVPQGPAPQRNAQQDLVNVAAADEQVSGAVTAIAASPSNPDILYLGTAGGGVWKSTNATATNPTWTPLTDNLKALAIGTGAVVFDPTDVTGQTLVVGTGRLSGYGRRGDDLAGLYYTTDGGATWTNSNSVLLSAASITGVAARGNTLLVASESGLFRTTTGLLGTWTQISGGGGLPSGRASSIAPDPINLNRLYVTFTGATGGIYRTDDLGATWSNVTNGITVISSATEAFNATVYNDGTTHVVTVVLNGTINGALGNAIYRSLNGAPFIALDVPTLSASAWGNYQIVADPINPNLTYVGGGYGVIGSNPFLPPVYRLDAAQPPGSQATMLSGGGTYGAPHVDINHLVIDASGGLLMGSHGGLFRLATPAGAASAANTWVSKNGNLAASEVHDIAYDPVANVMIAGLQDNAVVIQSAPDSKDWSIGPSFSGDGGDVAVADIGGGQSVRYGSSQNLGSFRRLVYNAANGLVSNTAIGTAAITDKQFTTPIAVNAVDPRRLLIGGSANLYESLDLGQTIFNIAVVGVNQGPGAIAYGGYQNGVANPDVLYIAKGSTVYKRTTAGGPLVATAALPTGGSTVRRVIMNPLDWTNIFAIDNDQVFASTNSGSTWADITGGLLAGLSSGDLSALEFVTGASPYIAVGTRSGVFATRLSNLGSWVKLESNLPDVLVFELDYDATDDVLAVGSLGRGAWLLANASTAFVPSNVAPVLSLSGPTTANEGTTQYSYSFTVNDPGDLFTVSPPTITGGILVPGSLATTGGGGSFKVTFNDGPATASISLQVTDSTGLASNIAAMNVAVANVIPSSVTINGAPASPMAGVSINLTNTVIDQSVPDQSAGFTYLWFVYKPTGAASILNSTAATFSFTPSIAGTYTVYLNATDKNGGTRQGSKVINVAASALNFATAAVAQTTIATPLALVDASLAANAATVTVFEGQPAENSGTFVNGNDNPVTLSASIDTLTRQDQIGCMTPPANLVSWWHGDSNVNDSVGSNHGTLQNGAGFATGMVGEAFSFDGVNDFVNIPASPSTELRNNLTVMAWFKINSMAVGSHAKILSKRNAAADFTPFEISLGYNGTNILAQSQGSTTGSSWDVNIVSSQPLTFGTWYHAAFVMDGNNLHTFYLNGQPQGTQQIATQLKSSVGDPLTIGTSSRGFPFNGLVDEIQYVNRPLSASEIEAMYNNCPAPAIAGTWFWLYTPYDGPATSQNVMITATDDISSEVTALTFTLVVENVAPSARLDTDTAVNEGSTANVAFANQADPSPADTTAGFRYAYDFDNNGLFEIGGDGTYSNAVTTTVASIPASFLADGPSTHSVLGRIIDKDGGYTDYTSAITINNAAPVAAPITTVSGITQALAGQVVTFLFAASDAPIDQLAGFTYTVNWGDGSPLQSIAPVAGTGDATARHAYPTAGSYTITLTSTDADGATSAPASATFQINPLTIANLQSLIDTTPVVYLQPEDDAALQNAVTVINGLATPQNMLAAVNGRAAVANPVALTLVLGEGPYSGVTLSPPDGIILDLAGNHTSDFPGTQIASSSGPAVTVAAGEVFVQGNGLATSADAPTVLVTGGHLTLDQSNIQESSGFNNVAVAVTGGSANFGFDLLLNINGTGGFVSSYVRQALVPHPEGIDAELSPNTFQKNGTTVNGVSLSSTGLSSSASPAIFGRTLIFTATISVKEIEHGPATGTVTFYDDAVELGSATVSRVGGQFVATYTTSSLRLGAHSIVAAYSGDNAYIASTGELTQTVIANQTPVAQGQTLATDQDQPIAITLGAMDADNDSLTYNIVAQPSHGTFSGAPPNLIYTPAVGYVGSDSFTFKANDGLVESNMATISITVNDVNLAPVASNDTYSTPVNSTLIISAPGVLSNDSDADNNPLTAVKVSNPAHGALTLSANGAFTYVPVSGYVGTDSFSYRAGDGVVTSNLATVILTVNGVITSPIQQVSFLATNATTNPNAVFPLQSPNGVIILTVKTKNLDVGLRNVSFRVVKLTNNNYLLNADSGPGQVGSKLSIANSALPEGNQVWDTNELLTADLHIGLMTNNAFVLQVDIYASKWAVTAAEADQSAGEEIEELVGSFMIEVDPDELGSMSHQVYLPIMNR